MNQLPAITSHPNFKKAGRLLNTLISKQDCGQLRLDRSTMKMTPKHRNTKEAIADNHYWAGCWLKTIRYRDYAAHWTQLPNAKWQETFYFTAAEYSDRCLLKIDVDCHHRGTLAGAVAFARWLKAHVFENLYFEKSTNGNGIHAYIILANGEDAEGIYDWATKLEANLRRHQHKFDVEMVEVKGHSRRIEREGRQIKIHAGKLAKVPREIVHRFDEFAATTKVDYFDWVFPELPDAIQPSHQVGSTTGRYLHDWHKYTPIAKTVMRGAERMKVDDDVAVTTEDVSILISILHHCSKNMNKDGTMPYRRIKGCWESLVRDGDTTRTFNAKRYVFARGLLDQCEYMLEWKSSMYIPRGGEGTACKWNLTAKFVEILDDIVIEDTHTPLSEGSLYSVCGWKPESEIICPEPLWPSLMTLPDADEVDKYLMSWEERDHWLKKAA